MSVADDPGLPESPVTGYARGGVIHAGPGVLYTVGPDDGCFIPIGRALFQPVVEVVVEADTSGFTEALRRLTDSTRTLSMTFKVSAREMRRLHRALDRLVDAIPPNRERARMRTVRLARQRRR